MIRLTYFNKRGAAYLYLSVKHMQSMQVGEGGGTLLTMRDRLSFHVAQTPDQIFDLMLKWVQEGGTV
jgi:hypothetical protein